ncbi:hypothetical protein VUR80DRAFT_8091 [Thermomyces stellatus]
MWLWLIVMEWGESSFRLMLPLRCGMRSFGVARQELDHRTPDGNLVREGVGSPASRASRDHGIVEVRRQVLAIRAMSRAQARMGPWSQLSSNSASNCMMYTGPSGAARGASNRRTSQTRRAPPSGRRTAQMSRPLKSWLARTPSRASNAVGPASVPIKARHPGAR